MTAERKLAALRARAIVDRAAQKDYYRARRRTLIRPPRTQPKPRQDQRAQVAWRALYGRARGSVAARAPGGWFSVPPYETRQVSDEMLRELGDCEVLGQPFSRAIDTAAHAVALDRFATEEERARRTKRRPLAELQIAEMRGRGWDTHALSEHWWPQNSIYQRLWRERRDAAQRAMPPASHREKPARREARACADHVQPTLPFDNREEEAA